MRRSAATVAGGGCLCDVGNTAFVLADGEEVRSNRVETRIKRPPCVKKYVDKSTACLGDELTYTVMIENPCHELWSDLCFTDFIPDGTAYVPHSFCVNGEERRPQMEGRRLTCPLRLGDCEEITVRFKVKLVGSHCCNCD